MSDLISREDAIDAVRKELVCDGRHEAHDKTCRFIADVILSALPSAEGGDAEVNETKSPYMQQSPNNGADLISRAEALKEIEAEEKRIERDIENAKENPNNYTDNFVFAEKERVNGLADAYIIIDGLPSADRPIKFTLSDGTEIPIDEESYEIGYTHGQMADRPTGEWVRLEREENVYDLHGVPTWGINYMCDKCGFITTAIQDHFGQYKFCPNCGADMRGGDDE